MNFILAMGLGISMSLLWGLLNTLQIIVHFKLLAITMPQNIHFLYFSIDSISNLNIVDPDIFWDRIKVFKDALNSNLDSSDSSDSDIF